MTPIFRLVLPAVGLAVAGCGTSGTLNGPPKSQSSAAAKAGPVELTETTAAGLDQAIAGQKGKVVLLDAWFRACSPCVKKFPHVVELAAKYGPDGLTVMSVDVLEEELKSQPEVLAFLREQKAAFPNYILTDPDTFTDKYGIRSTPAVVLFDRTGKRVDLPEKPTDDDVETAIRMALR